MWLDEPYACSTFNYLKQPTPNLLIHSIRLQSIPNAKSTIFLPSIPSNYIFLTVLVYFSMISKRGGFKQLTISGLAELTGKTDFSLFDSPQFQSFVRFDSFNFENYEWDVFYNMQFQSKIGNTVNRTFYSQTQRRINYFDVLLNQHELKLIRYILEALTIQDFAICFSITFISNRINKACSIPWK